MSDSIKNTFPLVAPLPVKLTPANVFGRLAHLPRVVFFDSATRDERVGRYSFVAANPFEWHSQTTFQQGALSELEQAWLKFSAPHREGLPPFQGGAAGLFGYELARDLETLPAAHRNDFPVPSLAVGLYDVVVAFDHFTGESCIISQGFPETKTLARRERAKQRIAEMQSWLTTAPRDPSDFTATPRVTPTELFDVGVEGITSNLSAAAYRKMIERAVEYIHAGDVFQVNLAQRLLSPARRDSVQLYNKLREKNPAPYAAYFDLGDWQICSTSPECFLTLRDGGVETRPIKGTRGRSHQPEADLFAGDELQLSEKDRAENVMIVDLLRNDLSRVCTPDSVQVSQLCQIESYAYVKHLVSTVRGTLAEGTTPFDLLRACFPGGSITGAPKIRAMEIIAELEPTTRGAYCGSLGYIGFDGQMDSNILIRTVTAGGGWWQMPVGGGIVAQSNPEDEYRETWHKARGMLQALK